MRPFIFTQIRYDPHLIAKLESTNRFCKTYRENCSMNKRGGNVKKINRRNVPKPRYCQECNKLIRPKERIERRRFHKTCAEKRAARKYPEQHRKAVLNYQLRHIELGLCPKCPREVFMWGLCQKHYEYSRSLNKTSRRK